MITKLGTVIENVPKVYASGYDTGHAMGYTAGLMDGLESGTLEGIKQGKQAEYDAFWDGFQRNGTFGTYTYAFAFWTEDTFKPKYDVYPINASNMFNNFNNGKTPHTNLTTHFESIGVKLDTSRCTNFENMFYFSWISRIPVLDTRKASNINNILNSATRTITVDKIILKDDGSQTFSYSFYSCTALVNIEFEGVIGNNINFKESTKLSAKSMVSVVEHLSDTTSLKTLTFPATAVNNADWSTTEYESWDALIATKPNWSFSLVS